MQRPFILALVLTPLFALAAVGALLLSLGGGDSNEPAQIEGRWSIAAASDVATLQAAYPITFVGTVTEEREQALQPVAEDTFERVRLPVTRFSVRVEESFHDDASAGDTVVIQQTGGVLTADGKTQRVVIEGDEPLVPGQRYLFFATRTQSDPAVLVSAPFSRFEVDEHGNLVAPEAWAETGVAQALAGLSITNAGVAIEAALEGTAQ